MTGEERADLAELRARGGVTEDAARPEAVERRHARAAAEENAKALNAATLFGIDDVIDPAETRYVIARTLRAARTAAPAERPRPVDTW